MLIDVKKKRRTNRTSKATYGGSAHDPQTQTHTVTAELGEGGEKIFMRKAFQIHDTPQRFY
jgi:hypothetical protein